MRAKQSVLLGMVCLLLAGVVACDSEQKPEVVVAKAAAAPLAPQGKSITADTGDIFHYSVNPCALVPKSAVEAFLRGAVAEPNFSLLYDIPPRLVCSYVTRVPENERRVRGASRLQLQVVDETLAAEFNYPSLETPGKFFTLQAEAFQEVRKDYEVVEGLGVPAYREPSNGSLHLLFHGLYVQVASEMAGPQDVAARGADLERGRIARNTAANLAFAETYLIGRVRP